MKEILKYLRQINSFSQERIAQKLGISRQSYIKYENGSVVPNNSTVHHLAAIYGVSEEFIRSNKIPSVQENSIKETAASIKKFYQYMSENNYVSVDDYKELCSFIKENMDEFLEQVDAFDNGTYYDMF